MPTGPLASGESRTEDQDDISHGDPNVMEEVRGTYIWDFRNSHLYCLLCVINHLYSRKEPHYDVFVAQLCPR